MHMPTVYAWAILARTMPVSLTSGAVRVP